MVVAVVEVLVGAKALEPLSKAVSFGLMLEVTGDSMFLFLFQY